MNIQMIYFFVSLFIFMSPSLLGLMTKNNVKLEGIAEEFKTFVSMPYTLIHELAHVLVALGTGGGGTRMELNRDLSGSIEYSTRLGWFGEILILAAGYPLSSLFALSGIYLLVHDQITTLWTIWFVLLVVGLGLIRNTHGINWIVGIGVITGIIFFFSPQIGGSILFGVLLHTASLQSFVAPFYLLLFTMRNEKGAPSDAYELKRKTLIPTYAWVLFFIFISTQVFIVYTQYVFIL